MGRKGNLGLRAGQWAWLQHALNSDPGVEQRGESPGRAHSVSVVWEATMLRSYSAVSLTPGKTCAGKTPGWPLSRPSPKAKEFASWKAEALRTEVVVVTGQQEEGERILEGAGLMTSGWKIPGPDAGA